MHDHHTVVLLSKDQELRKSLILALIKGTPTQLVGAVSAGPLLIGTAGPAVTARGSRGAGPPEQVLHAAVPMTEEPTSGFVLKLQLESN